MRNAVLLLILLAPSIATARVTTWTRQEMIDTHRLTAPCVTTGSIAPGDGATVCIALDQPLAYCSDSGQRCQHDSDCTLGACVPEAYGLSMIALDDVDNDLGITLTHIASKTMTQICGSVWNQDMTNSRTGSVCAVAVFGGTTR